MEENKAGLEVREFWVVRGALPKEGIPEQRFEGRKGVNGVSVSGKNIPGPEVEVCLE